MGMNIFIAQKVDENNTIEMGIMRIHNKTEQNKTEKVGQS